MMIVKIKCNYPLVLKYRHFWFTICNSQGRILATSETYTTKQSALKTVESIWKAGLRFKAVDLT